MKPEIGFVGLGTMGRWMALNLVKAGFPLKFFARRKEVIDQMTSQGGKPLPSLKDLAKESTWIIFCLPNTETVEEVLLGKDGMAAILKASQVIIDCGTIHPLYPKNCRSFEKQENSLLRCPRIRDGISG